MSTARKALNIKHKFKNIQTPCVYYLLELAKKIVPPRSDVESSVQPVLPVDSLRPHAHCKIKNNTISQNSARPNRKVKNESHILCVLLRFPSVSKTADASAPAAICEMQNNFE